MRGIRRRNATSASGTGATVTGQVGAEIKVGLQIKTDDNRFMRQPRMQLSQVMVMLPYQYAH